MTKQFSILLLACGCTALLLLTACGSNTSDPFADCAQGRPVAIFSDSLEAIASHQFEVKDKIGVEQVTFKNGVGLEVYQSGCDLVRQEFRFQLPGASPSDEAPFWVDQAINIFRFLGDLSEEHQAFKLWAGAMDQQAAEIQLGQEKLLGGNFFVKIDKIRSADSSILLVDFFQK